MTSTDLDPDALERVQKVRGMTLIAECEGERGIFDRAAKDQGHPLLAVASYLHTLWGLDPTRGSHHKWLAIMANECTKAANRDIQRRKRQRTAREPVSVQPETMR